MKISNENGFTHPLLLIAAVIAVTLIGFAGVRVYQTSNNNAQLNHSEEVAADEKMLPESLEGILTFEKIREIVTQGTDATITDFELVNEESTLIYKIRLSDGGVMIFNAQTGQALASSDFVVDHEEDGDHDEPLPANFTINISFDTAREIAQAEIPGSKIAKIQLDVEDGIVVLSVRFTDKARVDIDAITGEIVRTKAPRVEEEKNQHNSSEDDSSHEGSDDSSNSSSGNGDASNKDESDSSDDDSDSDDRSEIRIEGKLVSNSGKYTVSVNGTTYTIKADWNINDLIGETVRVEGILQAGNIIQAEKVDER